MTFSDGLLDNVTRTVDVPARVLIAVMFLFSGFGKVTAAAATQGYMEAHGVPGILVWPAAAWELVAGALLVLGYGIRPLSILLAGWCLLTAAIFHTAFGDPNQVVNFLKNLTMAGLFLMLARTGSPAMSLDAARASRRAGA